MKEIIIGILLTWGVVSALACWAMCRVAAIADRQIEEGN
jgi:hypothetical protein